MLQLCHDNLVIYKCLNQSAVEYLQELFVLVINSASRRHLRAATRGDVQVLATRTATHDPHSFAACAP